MGAARLSFAKFGALFFYVCAANGIVFAQAAQAESETGDGCKLLQFERKLPTLVIREPGRYCIDRDYRLSCSEWLGTCNSGPILDIYANDVELDLRGHVFSRSGRPLEFNVIGLNVRLRNGTIENGTVSIRNPRQRVSAINSDQPFFEPEFRVDSFIIVEDLEIEDGAINIVGANVTLRHNRILMKNSDLLAPVSIYGPRPVIENNTITRRTRPGKMAYSPYGIYLRYANGGTVRFNTIENDGWRGDSVAFGLRKSQGVLIENNTVLNFSRTIERIGNGDEQLRENIVR